MKQLIWVSYFFNLLIFPLTAQSQPETQISLNFRDVHLANIDQVLPDQKGEHLVTADVNGKILLWSTKDFKVIKTIQEGTGARVTGMAWINDGNTLAATIGNQGRYVPNGERRSFSTFTQGDQLVFFRPYDSDSTRTVNVSTDILGCASDSTIMLSLGDGERREILGLQRSNTAIELFRINTQHIVSKAILTRKSQMIAFTEYNMDTETAFLDEYTLSLVNVETKQQLFSKKYIDEKVVSFLFNTEETALHVLIFNRPKQQLRIEELDLKSFKSKIYLEIEMIDAPNKALIQNDILNSPKVLLTGMFSSDYILHFVNGKLEIMKTGLEKREIKATIGAMSFIPNSDYLVFWNEINSYFGNNPECKVWNHQAGVNINRFYEPPRTKTKGIYLPNDHWMVFGTETNTEDFNMLSPLKPYFKFYQQGTFNNRFAQLKFTDYLAQKFGISFYSENVEYALDEASGNISFVAKLPGADVYSGRYAYLHYNLLNDQLDTTNTVKVDYMIPIEFVQSTNRLLVKDYMRGEQYKVIEADNAIDFKGEFLKVHLSKSGEYLLLMDKVGEMTIYSFDLKKYIYKRKNKGWGENESYKLGTGDSNEFWISFLTEDSLASTKKYFSIVFNCAEGKVEESNMDNTWISGVAISGDKSAIILDGLGVYLAENRVIPFDYFNTPTDISLNQKADRLMVSLSNGTVEIYDTETLKRLGTMHHPDSYSHVIVDHNGHFASNTRTDVFLMAKNKDVMVDFEEIKSNRNRPEKILELFGTPDEEYLRILNLTSATFQNKAGKITKNSEGPVILDLKIEGMTSFSTTTKKSIQLELNLLDLNADIVKLIVNNNERQVLQKELKILKGKKDIVTLEIFLFPGENNLSVIAVDQNGVHSPSHSRTIYSKSDDTKKGDLYVLSVGISDYPEKRNDLTFADKDALDLAMIYSDEIAVDIAEYQKKFLGKRHSVYNKHGQQHLEIRNYTGPYNSLLDLTQVDTSGRYWLEVFNYEDFYLWDFQENSRIKIDIDVDASSWNDYLLLDLTGQGFGFTDKNSKQQYYSFKTKKCTAIEKPDDYDDFLIYFGNNNWLRKKETIDGLVTTVSIGLGNGKNEVEKYDLSFQVKEASNLYFKTSTIDRSKILLSNYDQLYLIINQGKKSEVEILDWKGFNKGESFAFSKDGNSINCLKKIYANEEDKSITPGIWFIQYDLLSKQYDSVFYTTFDHSKYVGLNNNGGQLRWVNVSESIAKEEGFFNSESEDRSKMKPPSFNKTHVKLLLNEQATQEEILTAMDLFLSKAKLEDQVIVFFAGHGILDTMLKFNFASYDMDFNKPNMKGISYELILEKLGRSSAMRSLLLMDACHSGTIFSEVRAKPGPDTTSATLKNSRGFETVVRGKPKNNISEIYDILFGAMTDEYGVTVLAASSGENLAYESKELSNGAFTGAYIESILQTFRGVVGEIDSTKLTPIGLSDELLYSMRKKVLNDTNGQQIPSVRSLNKKSKIMLY
ncbi:MAG: caspase family protein [Bacteroidetes bacterium]|nr:caspase family protein [Bacteroidota bacterium]